MQNWSDFTIIWNGGHALLLGMSPYSVPEFFYPLPLVYIIAILALLPLTIALIFWLILNTSVLIGIFRKRVIIWLAYFPVIHFFLSGQNEILWWTLALLIPRTQWGFILASLITLKPQTAIILLPYHLWHWLGHDRRSLSGFILCTLGLWLIPMLWQPDWISLWLDATPVSGLLTTMRASPSIFSLIALNEKLVFVLVPVSVMIVIWGLRHKNEAVVRAYLQLASPVGLFYTQMSLLGAAPAWLLTPTSLIAMTASLITRTFIPFIIVPLSVIIWHGYTKQAHQPLPMWHVINDSP